MASSKLERVETSGAVKDHLDAGSARLDAVTLKILEAAVGPGPENYYSFAPGGDKLAILALADRLQDLDLDRSYEAWVWAQENNKRPLVVRDNSTWLGFDSGLNGYGRLPEICERIRDGKTCERIRNGKTCSWPCFPSWLEAWHWLLVEWGRWNNWPGHKWRYKK